MSEPVRTILNIGGQNSKVIARRLSRMAYRLGVKPPVVLDGGPALNPGLVRAMEDELACDIHVPKWPQITAAIGAALLARDAHLAEAA